MLYDAATGEAVPCRLARADDARIKGAVADFSVIANTISRVTTLDEKAAALIRDERTARAETVLLTALRIRRHDPTTPYHLGLCCQISGDAEGAIVHWQHVLRFERGHRQARNNLGNVLALGKRWDEAQRCFEEGIEAVPDYPMYHHGLGNVLLGRGDIAGARLSYSSANQLDPTYGPAKQMLDRR